jgi:hypothetical protein
MTPHPEDPVSLSERSRSHVYRGLKTVIDNEEAVDEMLSHFPARDLDEPVTRDHLSAEIAALDKTMTERFAAADAKLMSLDQRMTIGFAAADKRMTIGFAAVDTRMTIGFAAVDKRMTDGFAAVDTRMTDGFAAVDGNLAALEQRMRDRHDTLEARINGVLLKWFLSNTALLAGAVIALTVRDVL